MHPSTPRFGLCCQLSSNDVFRFRTTTVMRLRQLVDRDGSESAQQFYEALVLHNLQTLHELLAWCSGNGIGAFRVGSDLWPRATHPLVQPWVEALFEHPTVLARMDAVRTRARDAGIRLSEHPDQFLVGNSLRPDVVASTIRELEFRGRLAQYLGIEVLCLHGGSGAPTVDEALQRWDATLAALSPAVLTRLAFENDDRVFTPADLLPNCLAWDVPLIYDVHHHRAHPDQLDEDEATLWAMASWGDREPFFHVSSPRAGWETSDVRPHAAGVEPDDWPAVWMELHEAGVPFTVDVEAKGKEAAILQLRSALYPR